MSTVYLIRHAPTVASKSGLASGLSSIGMDIIEGSATPGNVGQQIPDRVDLLVTSEFRRTQTTASALGVAADTYESTSAINEPDYGIFDQGPWTNFGAWVGEHGLGTPAPGAKISWYEQLRHGVTWLSSAARTRGVVVAVCHGYLWAACENFATNGVTPTVENIYSPPYLTALEVSREAMTEFGKRLESNAPASRVRVADKV